MAKRGRPKSEIPLEKVTLNLRLGDSDWLEIMRGPGWQRFIRELVSDYIDQHQRPVDVDTTIESLRDE